MKKHVEDQMKKAFEAWDEKPADLGLDKNLVWNTVGAVQPKIYLIGNWYKGTVAAALLFLTWGWGNTYFTNRLLQHENSVMANNIQNLSEELNTMHESQQEMLKHKEIKTDTIIKIINIATESPAHKILLKNKEQLEQTNNALLAENSNLLAQLNVINKQHLLLTDSLIVLAKSIKNEANLQSNASARICKDLALQVNEEALALLSNQSKEKIKAAPTHKKKFEIVLFNKSESYTREAPAKTGITF